MRKLDLDLLKQPSAIAWPSWALLVIGLLLCADMIASYSSARSLAQEMDMQSLSRHAAMPAASSAPVSAEELARAQELIELASIPWGDLFNAMENLSTEGVGILGFAPYPKENRVALRGEAASFASLLSLIAAMEQTPGFSEVLLEKHEIKRSDAQSSISFSLSARWSPP